MAVSELDEHMLKHNQYKLNNDQWNEAVMGAEL